MCREWVKTEITKTLARGEVLSDIFIWIKPYGLKNARI